MILSWEKTAFILGILALALCWSPVTGVLLAIVGVIVGALALSRTANKKLVIIGLILSIIGLLVASIITYATIAIYVMLSTPVQGITGLTHDIVPDACGSFGGTTVHTINDTQACLESCFENCQKKEMNLTSFKFNVTMPCNTCVCYCR